MPHKLCVLTASLVLLATAIARGQWQPAKGPLMTRWAKDVTPDHVHAEYPRPQMVRPDWQNLNGLWDYAIRPKSENRPAEFDGKILVPFPVESALSGVMKRVDEQQRLWYRRAFTVPPDWSGRRVLLHFGAVDWETTVWVNRKELAAHRGGYDPFTFDITGALTQAGEQEIVVAVWDPTDAGTQPRGKQVRKPEGIWYTPTTGIWQTAWLEPAPAYRIGRLKLTPDVDASRVNLEVEIGASAPIAGEFTVEAVVSAEGKEVARGSGSQAAPLHIPIKNARLWSPEAPFLYHLTVTLGGSSSDTVKSYFALRKVSIGKDADGVTRILLNNRPLFMYGPLDQGFWPDGLYTAPTDEALRYDIEITKKLGCNMARKHVKIESDRWYHWCDKLGLLVWQDMPSGDAYPTEGKREIERSADSAAQHELELKRMIDTLSNHPSIVMWVPFNESWGQYDTKRITDWVKKYDPTRLVNNASGWHDFAVGDVHDLHAYPGPASPTPEPARAAVLGEFGGLGLPVHEHAWKIEKSWGYRSFKSSAELTEAYVNLLRAMRPLIREPGLSAGVYTQTTDVEIEVNGLMTYDRAILKVDAERAVAAAKRLYLPPPLIKSVVPTAKVQAVTWRYTMEKPGETWYEPGFDDSAWRTGAAGFGTEGTPGAVVRTKWSTADIWLRRTFELTELPTDPQLSLYHDEDAEVYINGKLVASVKSYTSDYILVPLSGKSPLKTGENLIAIHCHQTSGGQGIDVGIVEVTDP